MRAGSLSASTTPGREISIFWDYENVPLPENCRSAAEVSKCIHMAVSKYGRIVDRRLYSDSRKWNSGLSSSNRRFLDSTGFDLVDTPSKGQKETIDKKMIADILSFAWDCSVRNYPCGVVLITSDGDYAYTLSKLRDRGVLNIVFYGRLCTVAQVLIETADIDLSFENDVLASILVTTTKLTREDHETVTTSATTISTNKSSSKDTFATASMNASLSIAEDESSTLQDFYAHADSHIIDFCKAVDFVQRAAQKKSGFHPSTVSIDDFWATDFHVGGYFKKTTPLEETNRVDIKQRYQNIRLQAISSGLVQEGKRIVQSRDIIPSFLWESGKELSTEVYLRLTQKGKSFLISKKFPMESSQINLTSRPIREVVVTPSEFFSSKRYLTSNPKPSRETSVQSFEVLHSSSNITHSGNKQNTSITQQPSFSPYNSNPDKEIALFCQCLHEIQESYRSPEGMSICHWVPDSSVAESYRKSGAKAQHNDQLDIFYEESGRDVKQRYQYFRSQAISDDLVQAGRRLVTSREIIPVDWGDNGGKRNDLSTEVYLRLTEKGKSLLAESKRYIFSSTQSAEVVGQSLADDISSITHHSTFECIAASTETAGHLTRSSNERSRDLEVFHACVYKLLSRNAHDTVNGWLPDSLVAALYNSHDTNVQYNDIRETAVMTGLIRLGRRIENENISEIGFADRNRRSLSDEIFIYLTSEKAPSFDILSLIKQNISSPAINEQHIQSLVDADKCLGKRDGSTESLASTKIQETAPARTLSSEEGVIIFCKCVKTLQVNEMKNNNGSDFTLHWVRDAAVPPFFRNGASVVLDQTDTNKSSIDYKSARGKAIQEGKVEAGRRVIPGELIGGVHSKTIVAVNWQDNGGGKVEGFAPELYLRLTEEGVKMLAELQALRSNLIR